MTPKRMPYEHDNQGHLLAITPVLLAVYAAILGYRESAILLFALSALLLSAHEAYVYWPKLYEFLRHRTYLLWHRYHPSRP